MSGKVYLVGAGPGDPGLLTLRAKELMERATVIVYDRLADERVLSFAEPRAKKIYVGKSAGRHTMTQEEISRLLAQLATEGETVVRLKGGDPFVFGRGGEEALVLSDANIPFEIVPGVSSAIAVPAYAGIPVTHRGMAASFAVITGHEDPTKGTSNINWDNLAHGTDTLIFLMGAANLGKITSKLIAAGRAPTTPAALIRWGTRAEQETVVTDLVTAPQLGIKPPVIFLVGETVRLRDKLCWFDDKKKRPLWGKHILVTRARAQTSVLTKQLTERGAKVVEAPAIKFAPPADDFTGLDKAIKNLSGYSWLIFTSANGVNCFFQRLDKAGLDSRAIGSAKIAAIGSATAAELKKHGLRADLVPQEYRAENLAAEITPLIKADDRILLARAEEARSVLPDSLRRISAQVNVASAYRTIPDLENADEIEQGLKSGSIDWITFTSSSTVKYLLEKINVEFVKNAKIACIGPITADTCLTYGITPTVVADEYTISGLVKAMVDYDG